MQVLIIGGCGFIGIHLQQRFIKEGHDVFVVDDLSGTDRAYLQIEKKNFYQMHAGERRIEEIFRTHNIDVVIWAAGSDPEKYSTEEEMYCRHGAFLWVLQLAKKYDAKKLLYLSSDVAYRKPEEMGFLSDAMAESCCFMWQKHAAIDLTVVRLAALYGERHGATVDVLSQILQKAAQTEEPLVLSAATSGGDFLYVEDAVDAIYRLTQRTYNFDVLDVASGTFATMEEIGAHLQEIARCPVRYDASPEKVFCVRMSPKRCEEELGWRPKYSLRQGMEKTYALYSAEKKIDAAAAIESKKGARLSVWRPYIENLLLFGVAVALMFHTNYNSIVNLEIGLDYNYLYIAIMGLLYGKKQSIPAVFLSVVLLLYSFAMRGADLVAILYQAQHMVHLASYLFFGVMVGYVTDNKERAYEDLEAEKNRTQERYQFLERMYLQNNEIKERLYRQIVNSDDSLGRTYKIVRKLDSIGVENIFTVANDVVGEVMGARDVAIYVFGRNQYYLRLKTRSGVGTGEVPNSLQVEKFAYLQEMMQNRQLFVNRLLVPGLPDMAAPILHEDKVIAVVQVYRLRFEDLSLQSQNQLKITTLLIADALSKAYRYEADLQDKRYIPGTQILNAEEFCKIKEEIRAREALHTYHLAALFRIVGEYKSLQEANERLAPLIRSEDFVGVESDGTLQVMMVNIQREAFEIIQQRFAAAGLAAELIGADHDGK